MSDKQYYQFDLNFNGDYIRGYSNTDLEHRDFAMIEDPEFHIGNDSNKYIAMPSNNTISLSKRHIVCYYKLNKD